MIKKRNSITTLPLQRRLRHLFSLEIRNFSLVNQQLSSHVLVHFTLQSTPSAPPFYISERLPVGVDLSWGGFNVKAILSAKKQSIALEQQTLSSRQLWVKVWKYDQISQSTTLLIDYNIDFIDLIPFNAAAYITYGVKYAPNTLVVNLVHGSYAFVLPSSPLDANRTNVPKKDDDSKASEEDIQQRPTASSLVSAREPKRSYTLSSVVRMCTVSKALRQSAELAFCRQKEIEQKLSERAGVVAAEQARERLRTEVEQMSKKLEKLEETCRAKREKLEMLRNQVAFLTKEADTTQNDEKSLSNWKDNMECNFTTLWETLRSKRKMVYWRRGQMLADIYEIYSIKRSDKLCSIADIPLPDVTMLPKSNANPSGSVSVPSNSPNAAGSLISVPFSTMSVALGYTAHYLLFIHWLFGIEPRYKIVFRGSHSAIFDHIQTQIATDADRTFPLYFHKDRSSFQRFRYAIFLLARDASQVRYILTQKKQHSVGAQVLENISWTLHDLFLNYPRFHPQTHLLLTSSTQRPTTPVLSGDDGDDSHQMASRFASHSVNSLSPAPVWAHSASVSSTTSSQNHLLMAATISSNTGSTDAVNALPSN